MTILHTYDDTANDSDKSFVVPAGRIWTLKWAHVRLTTTATVGNRQLRMQVQDDSANTVFDIHAGAVQAASLERHYEFMQGIYRETSFIDGAIQVPMPKCLHLLPGWTLRFKDENAVAAAADDMVVSFMYDERLERVEL